MTGRPSDAGVEARLQSLLAEHGRRLRDAVERGCPRNLGVQVDDLEQDVRLRLWRALESEREITNPASYIQRTVATAVIDAVRRAKARREEPLTGMRSTGDTGEVVGADRLPFADPGRTPEALASAREIGRKIEAALARIPEARRQVVRLHLQQFTTQEMASLLGWTEPKARNLVYRGLDDLRRELKAEGIDCETDA